MKRSHKSSVGQAAENIVEAVFSRSVDHGLWLVAYLGSMSVPQSTYGQIWRAGRFADEFVENVNYESLKHAFAEARRRGYIKKQIRGKRTWPEITQAGKQRLSTVLPFYDQKRAWDGNMYLITYDIPESQSRIRYKLRSYIKTLGCGRLQDSVWVTPYDPREVLSSYVREYHIESTIVVSSIGKGGYIGDEDIQTLLIRVYNLEMLSGRYEEWLAGVKRHEIKHETILQYLAILKDDPQLPFELLPPWWKGDEAYQKIEPVMKNLGFIHPTGNLMTRF